MLLLNTLPVFAQTSVTTDVIPIGGKWIPTFGNQPLDSLQAACELDFNFLLKDQKYQGCTEARLSSKQTYTTTTYTDYPNIGFSLGSCFAEYQDIDYEIINGKGTYICTGVFEEPFLLSFVKHTPATCPAPANGQRAADAADCECPVKPLKPITDPIAISFENGKSVIEDKLAPSMKTKLACLRAAVTKAGGTLTVNSAWRPQAYQDHLYEINEKRKKLEKSPNNTNPSCKPIYKAVIAERDKHQLKPKVAESSLHEKGLAFDANWPKITTTKVDALAATCGLSRRIKNDPPHFQ